MDFKKFMKQQNKVADKLRSLTDKKPSYIDEREWRPTIDKMGNGEALIRFLPQQDPSKAPIILNLYHRIKRNGKFYNEPCPLMYGKDCPSDQFAQPYWDEDTKESKKIASTYSKKRSYIANILVINDPKMPENNGKVFIYKFGVKIFDKIAAKISPKSEIDEPLDVLNFMSGHNFKVKIKKVGDWSNYDDCEFVATPSPVAKSESEMEAIYNKIYSLDEFENVKVKPYDELKKKFIEVIGDEAKQFFNGNTSLTKDEKVDNTDDADVDDPFADMNNSDDETEDPFADMNDSDDESKTETEVKDVKEVKEEKTADDDFDFDFDDDDFDFEK